MRQYHYTPSREGEVESRGARPGEGSTAGAEPARMAPPRLLRCGRALTPAPLHSGEGFRPLRRKADPSETAPVLRHTPALAGAARQRRPGAPLRSARCGAARTACGAARALPRLPWRDGHVGDPGGALARRPTGVVLAHPALRLSREAAHRGADERAHEGPHRR